MLRAPEIVVVVNCGVMQNVEFKKDKNKNNLNCHSKMMDFIALCNVHLMF